MKKSRLHVAYVLSSRYDDEGYVLRFWKGVLPSNTLCVLKALTQEVGETGALGDDIALTVETYDDTVQRVPIKRLAKLNRRADTQVLIGFVGVQTNQFARATDLALQCREAGLPVMMGGFHVSGALAMFDEPTPELQKLLDHGVTLVKGEAEAPGALAAILRDAVAGEMSPVYDIKDMPDLENAPIHQPDEAYLSRFTCSTMATVDTSRGCPFDCSFCTIINVQGRRMRARGAARVLESIERNYARGLDIYFFTDDNFSRSPIWEEVFDGLIAMRARGMNVKFMMQVDTQAYRLPNFVDKAAKAGCYMAFIGMETLNEENLEATGKRQNDVEAYATMVDAWHRVNVITHVGYIIGLPYDTRESVRRDIAMLRDAIKIDEASFFMLTPLTGSRDHRDMVANGVPMDADLNNFDGLHETNRHPRMAPGEWEAAYREAWETFYSKENVINIMMRTGPERYWQMFWTLIWYRFSTLSGTHPMFQGQIRLKSRTERRSIFPRESVPAYAWRRTREFYAMARVYAKLFVEFQEVWMLTRKKDDPRWATLADLRQRWVDARRRVEESSLRGRYDVAVQELHDVLRTASERLAQLSEASGALGKRAQRRVARLRSDIEAYLSSTDLQMPNWETVRQAEHYVSERVLGAYENLVIAYVAKRRKLNAYRQDWMARWRSGKVRFHDFVTLPRALVFELLVGLRFTLHFFRSS